MLTEVGSWALPPQMEFGGGVAALGPVAGGNKRQSGEQVRVHRLARLPAKLQPGASLAPSALPGSVHATGNAWRLAPGRLAAPQFERARFEPLPARLLPACLMQAVDQMSKKRAAFEDITNATVSLTGAAAAAGARPAVAAAAVAACRLLPCCLPTACSCHLVGQGFGDVHCELCGRSLRLLCRQPAACMTAIPSVCPRLPCRRRRPTLVPSRAPPARLAPAAATCSHCPSLARCVLAPGLHAEGHVEALQGGDQQTLGCRASFLRCCRVPAHACWPR